jgi:hypothetical protein
MDEHRFILLVAGRRWAKTTTMLVKLFKEAYEGEPGLYGYFAPTYRQAKLIAWEILKGIIAPQYRLGVPNESELFIKLKGGSTIRLFGLDKPEGILGIKLRGALLDEYDQTKNNTYEAYVRPALADTRGFCWFIGSPDSTKKKLKGLYDDIQLNARPDWAVFHYRTIDGGYVDKEELDVAKRELDPRTYREQFEASFEDLEGQVYYGFNPKHNMVSHDPHGFKVEYNPRLPIRFFFDFNVSPFCVGAAHFIEKEDSFRRPYKDVHVFDEFVIRNSNTPEMVKHILSKYENHKAGMIIYGDATGNSRDTSSSLSDYQIILDAFKNVPGFQLKVKNSNPAVKDRINAVNSKLLAYDGERHVFVKPGLKTLAKDFMNVTYKEGTSELDKSELELTHMSDAFGYMIDTEFPVARGYVR